MELCIPQSFLNVPNYRPINRAHLQWRPSLLLKKPPKSRFNSGLFYRKGSAIRAEPEADVPPTVEEKDDGAEPKAYKFISRPKVEGKEYQTVISKSEPEAYELYVPPTVEEKEKEKDDGVVESKSEPKAYEFFSRPKVEGKEYQTVVSKSEPEAYELYVPPTDD